MCPRLQSALLHKPGDVRAYGASDERVLFESHCKAEAFKHLLEYGLERSWLYADLLDSVRYLVDLLYIVLR